ncbi:MAG: Txe/YoeB family addiction module toxin [Scytonema sp. RU_4_4]|nr:Txe/YoeB family addiction module toxin [Scytonema sp. RU_4_4]
MTKHSNASDSQQPERSSFFTKQFKEDIKYWKKHCQAKYNRIQELIQETKEKPFDGKGNPKPLVHINYEGHKASARRIDEEHRLVYVVTADKIFFLQARYHYEKK